MYTIILCGGSGTRLWPLSRNNFPKQFLSLVGDKSLLQQTYQRALEISKRENILFVTNKKNFFNVINQIREIDTKFEKENILIEPRSLNTAPAILLAVKYLLEKKNIDPKKPIISLHSDHYINNNEDYIKTIKLAEKEIGNNFGTISITPNRVETDYGYIKKGEKIQNHYKVLEFKEKPDLALAKEYVASGRYFWNSGIYIFTTETLEQELSENAPELYDLFSEDYEIFVRDFSSLPNISFDEAVSERSKRVITFSAEFDWDDIGSLDRLVEVSKSNNSKTVKFNSQNIFSYSINNKMVVTSGVNDLIIVDTKDAILVQKRGNSEKVREVVDYLKKHNCEEIDSNLLVHRPWGSYEILIDTPTYKVKKIMVRPDAKLSLQLHYHRSEHWIVVRGIAKVTNGEKTMFLKENESTFISELSAHRLENPGKMNLELIEVQTGNYLGEDDIIRTDDEYDRI